MIATNENFITAVFDGKSSESILRYLTPYQLAEQLIEHIAYNRFITESDNKLLTIIRDAKVKADQTSSDIAVDEGLLSGVIGALTGAAWGPKVGKALCDALGVTKGFLYDLFTSRLFTTAVCAKLGLKI